MLFTTFIYAKSINLFQFNILTKFMINKEKTFLSADLSLLQCHALKYFLPGMDFSTFLQVVPKKNFSSPTMMALV